MAELKEYSLSLASHKFLQNTEIMLLLETFLVKFLSTFNPFLILSSPNRGLGFFFFLIFL